MVADSTFPHAGVGPVDKWLFFPLQGTNRGADLTHQSTSSPGLGFRASCSVSETHAAQRGAAANSVSLCVCPCLLNMRPSHVNWQKICRLDRYPQCPRGKHGEGGLWRVHPRWSGKEREGRSHDPARNKRELPLAPRASRSGRKQKEWETGLTIRERSPRYGATLEPGDVPPIIVVQGGGRGRGFFFFFNGARLALTHRVAGGLTTQKARFVKRGPFFPLPRDVGIKISARVDLVPAHFYKPETGPEP